MREAELKNKQSKSSPWITSIGNINFLFCLVLAIIIFLVILFILILENYYIKPSSAEEKTNFLSMVGGLLGGGSLLFGVYFAWKQLQVAFDGMITDRISQAVEHRAPRLIEHSGNCRLKKEHSETGISLPSHCVSCDSNEFISVALWLHLELFNSGQIFVFPRR